MAPALPAPGGRFKRRSRPPAVRRTALSESASERLGGGSSYLRVTQAPSGRFKRRPLAPSPSCPRGLPRGQPKGPRACRSSRAPAEAAARLGKPHTPAAPLSCRACSNGGRGALARRPWRAPGLRRWRRPRTWVAWAGGGGSANVTAGPGLKSPRPAIFLGFDRVFSSRAYSMGWCTESALSHGYLVSFECFPSSLLAGVRHTATWTRRRKEQSASGAAVEANRRFRRRKLIGSFLGNFSRLFGEFRSFSGRFAPPAAAHRPRIT